MFYQPSRLLYPFRVHQRLANGCFTNPRGCYPFRVHARLSSQLPYRIYWGQGAAARLRAAAGRGVNPLRPFGETLYDYPRGCSLAAGRGLYPVSGPFLCRDRSFFIPCTVLFYPCTVFFYPCTVFFYPVHGPFYPVHGLHLPQGAMRSFPLKLNGIVPNILTRPG